MRARVAAVAVAVAVSGCSLAIDPGSVAPPCAPACTGKACGADDGCGHPCASASGCVATHVAVGRTVNGAAASTATGGHGIAAGALAPSERAAADNGHRLEGGICQ